MLCNESYVWQYVTADRKEWTQNTTTAKSILSKPNQSYQCNCLFTNTTCQWFNLCKFLFLCKCCSFLFLFFIANERTLKCRLWCKASNIRLPEFRASSASALLWQPSSSFTDVIRYAKCHSLSAVSVYTEWRNKNVPNFRTALCAIIKINEVKSTYSVRKHLRISLKIFA